MQRRSFVKKTAAVAGAMTAVMGNALASTPQEKQREVYELRVYQLRWSQAPLDQYLSKALIPAVTRLGARRVGVFRETSRSEPTKVYVLIAYPSFEDFGKVSHALRTDEQFLAASAEYDKIPANQAVYDRYESSLLLAIEGLPVMEKLGTGPRMFELRTYEGYSDDAVRRKVKMFNEGELDIFRKVKLNSVFFGEMIAGKQLPCLVYMLSFRDMEEREANWKTFIQDPDWARISKDPAYADTVSRIYKVFLEPLPYSQV